MASEQTSSGVALVVFHNIRRFIGIQNLSSVLTNLLEGFLLKLDLDSGLLLEDFHGFGPRLALCAVVFLVMPDFDGLRI